MTHIYTPENLNTVADNYGKKQAVIVLGAIRDSDKRVLVAQRVEPSVPDAVGRWEFVGGRVDFGEEPETALAREVLEESGLRVRIIRLLPKVFTHVWKTDKGSRLQVFMVTYECEVTSGTLSNRKVTDEIGELKFVSLGELVGLDLLPNVRESIQYL